MHDQRFSTIRRLVEQDELERAVQFLVASTRDLRVDGLGDRSVVNRALNLSGRLAGLRRERADGVIQVDEERVERSRIRISLLSMLKDLERQYAGPSEVGDNAALSDGSLPPQATKLSADAALQMAESNASAADQIDILIMTVLPEEYAAVLRVLANARPVQGTPGAPNLYGWRLGSVARAYGGAYRVALALMGSAGNVNASQAVVRSAERWRPRYVLLVGIAGGLPREGCAVGDVVVSTEIFGYEYGKLDSGFHPRPNWTYPVDRGLLTSAQAFTAANPDWWAGAAPAPRVLFGPIASGEKVVDDPADPSFAAVIKHWPKLQAVEMEGAGAAAAIEELRAVGSHALGFLMIRGISDMPRPPGERAEGGAAQTTERDANKKRACDVAAGFALRWIAAEWPIEPRWPRSALGA